ncbi:MAG: hypothetical protein HYV27_24680 [Candidatus Hydrogenedentes bacterium]|nr:hypothetical protein [Candidatus Hydrogenedentota bacterium]
MNSISGLPLRFSGADAVAIFNRPRIFNLYGLLRWKIQIIEPTHTGKRTPPCAELLWMPAYAIRFASELRGKPSFVWASVDGCGGHVQILEDTRYIIPLDVEEETIEPVIGEDEAAALGRKGLLHYTLRERRLFKPIVKEVEEFRLFWYPVWVCYVPKRFKTRLDVLVLEAHSGRRAGSRLRIAVVNALIAQSKARKIPGESTPDATDVSPVSE